MLISSYGSFSTRKLTYICNPLQQSYGLTRKYFIAYFRLLIRYEKRYLLILIKKKKKLFAGTDPEDV